MKIYLASFTAREKDWGTAEKQELWMIKKGLTNRLLSYYAILKKQAESRKSFESYIKFKKHGW